MSPPCKLHRWAQKCKIPSGNDLVEELRLKNSLVTENKPVLQDRLDQLFARSHVFLSVSGFIWNTGFSVTWLNYTASHLWLVSDTPSLTNKLSMTDNIHKKLHYDIYVTNSWQKYGHIALNLKSEKCLRMDAPLTLIRICGVRADPAKL